MVVDHHLILYTWVYSLMKVIDEVVVVINKDDDKVAKGSSVDKREDDASYDQVMQPFEAYMESR